MCNVMLKTPVLQAFELCFIGVFASHSAGYSEERAVIQNNLLENGE